MNFNMQLKDGTIQGHWNYKDLEDDDKYGIGAVLGEEIYQMDAYENFDTKKTTLVIWTCGGVLEIYLNSNDDLSVRRLDYDWEDVFN